MNKGFSLLNLLLVIALLGMIFFLAIPKYINNVDKFEKVEVDAIISSVNSGINLYRADDMVSNGPPGRFPLYLDGVSANASCSEKTPCFNEVANLGITDDRWSKVDRSHYRFSDGTNIYNFVYIPKEGLLKFQN